MRRRLGIFNFFVVFYSFIRFQVISHPLISTRSYSHVKGTIQLKLGFVAFKSAPVTAHALVQGPDFQNIFTLLRRPGPALPPVHFKPGSNAEDKWAAFSTAIFVAGDGRVKNLLICLKGLVDDLQKISTEPSATLLTSDILEEATELARDLVVMSLQGCDVDQAVIQGVQK
jgi:hypothetical protein